MDTVETTETNLDMDSHHRVSVHNMQDILKYSQHLKKKGILVHCDTLTCINILSSVDKELTGLKMFVNKNSAVKMCLQLKKFKPHIFTNRKLCYHLLHQYYSLYRNRASISNAQMNKHLLLYQDIMFNKRKLLSSSPKSKQNVKKLPKVGKNKNLIGTTVKQKTTRPYLKQSTPLNASADISNSSKEKLEKLALQELEEYEEFVEMMEQTFSKDPLRAMLSVSFLLIVMMLAMKCCGMKPVNKQEKQFDMEEDIHYVNIHDILKRKRRYLPKYLLTWERRLRRKFKRRQRLKREREQEVIADPVSDNSEEESLIYGGTLDF